jgi:ElaA protein
MCEAWAGALEVGALYGILRLRAEVFVVEQDCVYLDPDGRDLEASTRHLWIEDGGAVIACLRLLSEPDGTTIIGRVVTTPDRRAAGLGGGLMRRALELAPDGPVRLHAQSRLERWYAGFGFVVDGEEYIEDGIPHVPMRLRIA